MGPAYKVLSQPIWHALYSNLALYAPSAARQDAFRFQTDESGPMHRGIRASLFLVLVLTAGSSSAAAQSTTGGSPKAGSMSTDVTKIKEALLETGKASRRKSAKTKSPDGSRSSRSILSGLSNICLPIVLSSMSSTRLTRTEPCRWQGSRSLGICLGRDHILSPQVRRRSTSSRMRPMRSRRSLQGFADVLNKVASAGYAPWAVNSSQSIFGKNFVPFGLKERSFRPQGGDEFHGVRPIVYLRGDLLFWGARNIDGRGFDTEQNRPTIFGFR